MLNLFVLGSGRCVNLLAQLIHLSNEVAQFVWVSVSWSHEQVVDLISIIELDPFVGFLET